MNDKHILETLGVLCVKQYLLYEKPFIDKKDYDERMGKAIDIGRQMYDLVILVKDKIGPIETEIKKPQDESGSLEMWQHLHILSNLLSDKGIPGKDLLPEWAKKSMERLL